MIIKLEEFMEEWIKIKRTYVQKDEPSVTVSKRGFRFNAVMIKLAELEKYVYVTFYVNDTNRQIAFEFKENFEEDSYKLTKDKFCEVSEILKRQWVSKVTELKGQNVFVAKKDGKKWVITLCPAFEISIKRNNIKNIQGNISGIYRYLDSDCIVYIGKGNIKNRYNSPDREKWKFDVIEYSVIEDDEKALEWENYWLDKYKVENNGQLPTYNLISGHSS